MTQKNQSKNDKTAADGNKPSAAHSVTLPFGYQDKEETETVHKIVKFSKRPTGADFIDAIEATKGEEPSYILAMMTAAISAFGTLKMPVPMTVLLSLNWRDRELLTGKFFEFLGNTSGETDAESAPLPINQTRLSFGIERDGIKYTVVEFGAMMTAYDEIAVNKEASNASERHAAIVGREIVKVLTNDRTRQADGGLTLDEIKALDWVEWVDLQKAEEIWRDSFRK